MRAGATENSFRDLGKRGAKQPEMKWKGTWGQGRGVVCLEAGRYRAHLSANGTEPVGEGSPLSQRTAMAQGLPKHCLTAQKPV